MTNFSLSLRRLWLPLVLVLATASSSLAQIQYANSVATASNAGFVFDDAKAADGDLTTRAIIAPATLLGFTRLRVTFPAMAQANKPAGLYLKANPLLSLALVGTTVVNTYLLTGTTSTPVESFTLTSNLLNLSLLSSGLTQASFTPTKQFNQVEIVVFALLSLGGDVGVSEAYSTPVKPLPVVLTAFQGQDTPAGVALRWATASELNTSHFVVERATDARQDFRPIGRVASAGTATESQHYQLLDSAPALLNYYRLRQVDRDGTETFGPVVAVVHAEPASPGLAAYPNPATEQLTVRGPVGTSFVVLDQMCRRVGAATVTTTSPLQLDVRNLPPGTYYLQDAATGKSTRFVKITP